MSQDPLFLQRLILQCAGIIPLQQRYKSLASSTGNRVKRLLLTGVAVSLLLGNLACCLAVSSWALNIILQTSGHLLLKLCAIMPLIVYSYRPLLILFAAFRSRHRLEKVCAHLKELTKATFDCQLKRKKLLKKWRKLSVVLFGISFSMYVALEVWNRIILSDINFDPRAPLARSAKSCVWTMEVIWTVFSRVNYVLSMQVINMVVIVGVILSDTLRQLNRNIRKMTESFRASQGEMSESHLEQLTKQISSWKRHHGMALDLCRMLNRVFGCVLFFHFGMNFLGLLGIGANILVFRGEELSSSFHLYYSCAALMNILYNTVYLLPLIWTHDESVMISRNLTQLSYAAESVFIQDHNQKLYLLHSLDRFEASSRHNICSFTGGHLFDFTRSFVIGSCTVFLSLFIFAKQLIDIETRGASSTSVHSLWQLIISGHASNGTDVHTT